MSTTEAESFLALPKSFQDRIDKAFSSVAFSVNSEPPSKRAKLQLGTDGGDSDTILNDGQSPTKEQDLRISISSIPDALRKLNALPDDKEFLTSFHTELGSDCGNEITQSAWRQACAVFLWRESVSVAGQQESGDAAEAEVPLDKQARDLVKLLLETRDEEPLLPLPALDSLSITNLVAVAKTYIDEYPYGKELTRYWPNQLTPSGNPSVPDDRERKRFRLTLKAFVDFPRGALRVLDQTLDPDAAQREFIMKEIMSQRGNLEIVGSKHWALLESIRAETATPSALQTPLSGGQRDKTVPESVRQRDNYRCLMTGIMSDNRNYRRRMRDDPNALILRRLQGQLQVAHGVPHGLQGMAWVMLRAMTGMSFNGWKTDCTENAFVLLSNLHALFGSFKLYLELDDENQFIVRGRKSPELANPMESLEAVSSAYTRKGLCHEEDILLDQPLHQPPPLPSNQDDIPFLDFKFFHLHRLIGDVFWMVASADPSVLESDDEKEEKRVLNEKNIFGVLDKLVETTKHQILKPEQGLG